MFIDSPQALALLTKISRSVAPWVFGGSRGARSSWEGRKTGNRSSFHGKRSEFPCSFALLKRSLPALLLPKFLRSKWVRGSTFRNFNYVPRCYTLIGQMMSVEISLKLRRKTENTSLHSKRLRASSIRRESLRRKPPPSSIFFCSHSYFRAITRSETLATQARYLDD